MEDLPEVWTRPKKTARLHILRAHDAPKAVIIRRKPSKCAHVISWDTTTDELTHGSWFRGRVYAERCDLSWDGKWMVYMAMGAKGNCWNGICQPPHLRSPHAVPNLGAWAGGGYFVDAEKLISNDHFSAKRSLTELWTRRKFPFRIESMESEGEAFPILEFRMERDGWEYQGEEDEFVEEVRVHTKASSYAFLRLNDPGWAWQPTPQHPVLRMYYRGYLVHGYTFEFQLEGSDLLDLEVDWAAWDSKGDLLVARSGAVARYTLDDLATGTPSFEVDLEGLTKPEPNPAPPQPQVSKKKEPEVPEKRRKRRKRRERKVRGQRQQRRR